MTKDKINQNQSGNTWADKVMQGAAAFVLSGLAYHEVLRHIRATQPVSFGLAGMVVAFLMFLILAPLFRTK